MFRGDAVEMVVIHYLLFVNNDDTTVMITRQSNDAVAYNFLHGYLYYMFIIYILDY